VNKPINRIDYAAIVLLCLSGLVASLLIGFTGMPQFGALSELWRNFGIVNLFAVSILCFCIASAVLGRQYSLGCAQRHWLLALLIFTGIPTAFFSLVFLGKAIQQGLGT
jgi:hypothetical protein